MKHGIKYSALAIPTLLFLLNGIALGQQKQPPVIEWQQWITWNEYWGIGGAFDIQVTRDNGYIVAAVGVSDSALIGFMDYHWGRDYWIIKFDSAGTVQWEKLLGGSGDDVPRSIEQTRDGGYIVVGWSSSTDGDVTGNHGGYDYWVVKLNSIGTIQWEKSYGGSQDDIAENIRQTIDGGYIVAGTSYSSNGDVSAPQVDLSYSWVLKLNDTGAIEWEKCYGSSIANSGLCVIQTQDSGYITGGYSNCLWDSSVSIHGQDDYLIEKLDDTGAIQWQQSYGGIQYIEGEETNANEMRMEQTADGGYIIAGQTSSFDGEVTGQHSKGGYDDLWVIKIDHAGILQWERCVGGSEEEEILGLSQTNNGGFIAVVYSNSNDDDFTGNYCYGGDGCGGGWLVKFDSLGNIQWKQLYGINWDENGYCAKQTSDGGYIMAGSTPGYEHGSPIIGSGYVWLVKLSPDTNRNSPPPMSFTLLQNYPNPSSQITAIIYTVPAQQNISLGIYNTLGQSVATLADGSSEAGTHKINYDCSQLASGTYFLRLRSQAGTINKQLVVVH
jgi:hypothetical protein